MSTGEPVLFSKFKPMLAQRLRMEQISKIVDGSLTFSCEAKYDGERILAHIDVDAKRVELYTRNAIDYTASYAPSTRSVFLGGLIGRQAVVDGEMLAWDEAGLGCACVRGSREASRLEVEQGVGRGVNGSCAKEVSKNHSMVGRCPCAWPANLSPESAQVGARSAEVCPMWATSSPGPATLGESD